jgi:hypothetical protein
MATGLFLGAGASYEVGMPLVWDLTAELKAWLTPDKLRELNRGWRAQRGGNSDEVIEKLASVLVLPELHYESILGFLRNAISAFGVGPLAGVPRHLCLARGDGLLDSVPSTH